jgi:Ca-activated chloride channel homolog
VKPELTDTKRKRIYLKSTAEFGDEMAHGRGVCLVLAVSLTAFSAGPSIAQVKAKVRIVANVELIRIPVMVFDDKGAVAAGLTKSDFRVVEDGVEQQILYCEREREPVSFVMLDDVSSSMTRKLPFVQEATLSILDPPDPQNKNQDEFSVFGIESRVRRLVPFTRDQQDLQRRLPLLLTPTNGSTALFDGVYIGVTAAEREAENARRAVIIISDGGDNHSRYNLRETKRLLEEADVPVFAVMAGPSFELPEILQRKQKKAKPSSVPQMKQRPELPNLPIPISHEDHVGPAERRGPHNLKILTEVTGGGVFTAHDVEDLPRIVRTISLAVRYRYVLTYKPAGEAVRKADSQNEDADSHKIQIELYPKEKFKGYGIPYYKHGYRRLPVIVD